MTAVQQHEQRHIVIVGGGITGLSAAFYLQREAHSAGVPVQYTLIERAARIGGKILTEHIEHDGSFIVEGGPDSFLAQKPWGVELVRELGLEDQLLSTNEAYRQVFVLRKGRPCPLPAGVVLSVPSRILPFALSPLISLPGKLRMAQDLFIPPRRDDADETLAAFIRRRLGSEALDTLAAPLMAGIHSADPEQQSMRATFPQFQALEQTYGSLIRGMCAQRRTMAAQHERGTPFVTLREGVGQLVDALVAQLDGRLITGHGVAAIDHDPDNCPAYRVRLDDGESLAAHAIILTIPAFVAANLVAPFHLGMAMALRKIRYVSTATISLAYRQRDIGDLFAGFGLIIPQREQRAINACTVSSLKFTQRAPEHTALLRVFVGGSYRPELIDLDDTALLALVRAELRQLLGINTEPLFSRIYRWPNANPQYDLGHLDRVAALETLCPPGLYLCGCAYRGVGIPDCIRQAKTTAAMTLNNLQEPALTNQTRTNLAMAAQGANDRMAYDQQS